LTTYPDGEQPDRRIANTLIALSPVDLLGRIAEIEAELARKDQELWRQWCRLRSKGQERQSYSGGSPQQTRVGHPLGLTISNRSEGLKSSHCLGVNAKIR
jgi:hypothetical protein